MIHSFLPSRSIFTMALCAASAMWLMSNPASAQSVTERLDRIERNMNVLSSGGNGSLPSFQVNLSQMQEELRAIRGGIEENNHAIKQLKRDMKLAADDNEYRLRTLEDQLGGGTNALGEPIAALPSAAPAIIPTPPAPAVPQAAPQTLIPAAVPVSKAEANPLNQQARELDKKKLDPAVVATTANGSGLTFSEPREHYNYAVGLINDKRFESARNSFLRFVNLYPDHWLIPNAYYWMGETYYVNSDFITSADLFRQGFEVNPESIKAPDNLYKLAKSMVHLNKRRDACLVFTQIQKRYSDANPEVAGLAFESERTNNCSEVLN